MKNNLKDVGMYKNTSFGDYMTPVFSTENVVKIKKKRRRYPRAYFRIQSLQ